VVKKNNNDRVIGTTVESDAEAYSHTGIVQLFLLLNHIEQA